MASPLDEFSLLKGWLAAGEKPEKAAQDLKDWIEFKVGNEGGLREALFMLRLKILGILKKSL